MRAGTLMDWITIQERTDTQDETGEMVPGWADAWTVKADVRYLSGLEAIKSNAPANIVKASVRVRSGIEVDATMRVLIYATILDIKAVLPGGQRGEYLDLTCETGASEG
jgi:SPP1 family predicted phage head-tail adaptor